MAPLLLHALVITGRSACASADGLHDPAEGMLALFGAG